MLLSTIEKVLILSGVELFSAIHAEELVPLARVAREIKFEVGEVFIRQGDIGDCMYVLAVGEARVVIPGVGQIAYRKPRSVIGEMAVISRQPRSADCIAATDITALRIDHDDFWEILDEQPALARGVIKVLAQRLDEAVHNLQELGRSGRGEMTKEGAAA